MSLVLTRKVEQTIKIDDDITIKVVRIDNGQVRLAIDAPAKRKVLRGELSDRDGRGRTS